MFLDVKQVLLCEQRQGRAGVFFFAVELNAFLFFFFSPPLLSQVILVQVNPGEAFTIRREDGQFQCITGKPCAVQVCIPNEGLYL